jgi:transcription termination factor Rho
MNRTRNRSPDESVGAGGRCLTPINFGQREIRLWRHLLGKRADARHGEFDPKLSRSHLIILLIDERPEVTDFRRQSLR